MDLEDYQHAALEALPQLQILDGHVVSMRVRIDADESHLQRELAFEVLFCRQHARTSELAGSELAAEGLSAVRCWPQAAVEGDV